MNMKASASRVESTPELDRPHCRLWGKRTRMASAGLTHAMLTTVSSTNGTDMVWFSTNGPDILFPALVTWGA